jgi:2-dehydro-3-deoxyphosphooctonate aldolase (KDO 8-P synthase)
MNPSFFNYASPQNPNIFFIAGPCVIESEDICLNIADRLAAIAAKRHVDIVFKASYDKANRLQASSFRGIGRLKGLKILAKVKNRTGLPLLTDIHDPSQAKEAAEVADVLQIPALLCRQTDLIAAAGRTGRWVNIKKGQFMAPEDMKYALEKAGRKVWLTERGTSFGYKRLVVDFAGIPIMKRFGVPVVFDATHSVQVPGGGKGVSSGNRKLATPLAKAAIAMGVDGLFFEVHPNPDKALCDGPNSLAIKTFEKEVPKLIELFHTIHGAGKNSRTGKRKG